MIFTTFAAESGPHISIAPQILWEAGPFAISNSQVLGLFGTGLVLWLLFSTARAAKSGKRMNRLQGMVMWVFEMLYKTTVDVIGDRATARKVAPLGITIVFFFAVNNWFGLLPGVGAVTLHGEELFRGVAADLNTTLAIAIISIVTAQLWAVKRRGFKGNLSRYLVNPLKSPIHSFIGILEILAEISRTAALALRMFGNVLGGEVLLAVIGYLTGYAGGLILPVFYCLELFVGGIQAYVFFMLTIAFISLALPAEGETHGAH
jgi:F-type H+-transporting ATPase subunit a